MGENRRLCKTDVRRAIVLALPCAAAIFSSCSIRESIIIKEHAQMPELKGVVTIPSESLVAGCRLLIACISGDREAAIRAIRSGADVNFVPSLPVFDHSRIIYEYRGTVSREWAISCPLFRIMQHASGAEENSITRVLLRVNAPASAISISVATLIVRDGNYLFSIEDEKGFEMLNLAISTPLGTARNLGYKELADTLATYGAR